MKLMRIRELREAAELTQGQLATHLGLSQCTISAWETEVYLPKSRQLPVLARVFGCEISDLFVSECEEVS